MVVVVEGVGVCVGEMVRERHNKVGSLLEEKKPQE